MKYTAEEKAFIKSLAELLRKCPESLFIETGEDSDLNGMLGVTVWKRESDGVAAQAVFIECPEVVDM